MIDRGGAAERGGRRACGGGSVQRGAAKRAEAANRVTREPRRINRALGATARRSPSRARGRGAGAAGARRGRRSGARAPRERTRHAASAATASRRAGAVPAAASRARSAASAAAEPSARPSAAAMAEDSEVRKRALDAGPLCRAADEAQAPRVAGAARAGSARCSGRLYRLVARSKIEAPVTSRFVCSTVRAKMLLCSAMFAAGTTADAYVHPAGPTAAPALAVRAYGRRRTAQDSRGGRWAPPRARRYSSSPALPLRGRLRARAVRARVPRSAPPLSGRAAGHHAPHLAPGSRPRRGPGAHRHAPALLCPRAQRKRAPARQLRRRGAHRAPHAGRRGSGAGAGFEPGARSARRGVAASACRWWRDCSGLGVTTKRHWEPGLVGGVVAS